MRISDWSSDVCSSDLAVLAVEAHLVAVDHHRVAGRLAVRPLPPLPVPAVVLEPPVAAGAVFAGIARGAGQVPVGVDLQRAGRAVLGSSEPGCAGHRIGRAWGGGEGCPHVVILWGT